MLKTDTVYVYDNYDNTVVIQKYLEIIAKAMECCGYKCKFIKKIDEYIDKKNLIVFPTPLDAFKYYFKGYKNIILWQQGANADESYMRNKSKMRYYVLNYIDCFVIKKAKFIFFVSDYMLKHYEKLTHRSLENKSYIMPCFNEVYDKALFEKKNYTKPVFTYVGSLAVWQCFEQTAEIYSKIEKQIPDAFFKVLTFEVDKAKKILEKMEIKNYEVKCVAPEDVNNELLEASYGFVIREDNVVNRVATPTKLSSYLAAGVIPIYSKCLVDFDIVTRDLNCAFGMDKNEDVVKLINFVKNAPCPKALKNDIEKIFATYYNADMHIKNISQKSEGLLK